jgi:biotin carboxylase
MKTLWVVGGGTEAVPGIKVAKSMGLLVALSDGDSHAPGKEFADYFYCADTYSLEDTLEAVKGHIKKIKVIDGIIALAADVPSTIAYVCNELRLPGQSIETAKFSSNKLLMKEKFLEQGIRIPWFHKISSLSELQTVISLREGIHILKPVDSRGARGVLQVDQNSNLEWCFSESLKYSPSKTLILEEFIPGPQFSTESLIQNGDVWNIGFADRNYANAEKYAPFFIEDGGTQPSSLNKDSQAAIFDLAASAGRALGLSNGIIKGDMVLSNGKPYVIEIATRLSGGWFSSILIPASTSVPIVKYAILQALGEDIPGFGRTISKRKAVAIRYIILPPGVRLPNPNQLSPLKSRFVIFVKYLYSGPIITKQINSHVDRIGLVITKGFNRKHAVFNAERSVRKLRRAILSKSQS